MSLIAISNVRKSKSDTPYKIIRRIWGLESSERIVELVIVSAYTDPTWIKQVIDAFRRNRKFQCLLDYSASGYTRDNDTTKQLDDLAKKVGNKYSEDSGIFLVQLGRFLHSKILIVKTSERRTLGAVGSLNFTRRGFLDNEEIVYVVNNPKSLLRYASELKKKTIQIPFLLENVTQHNIATYRDWMLAGSIFYEDRETNPFNFKLELPEELRSQGAAIVPGAQAEEPDYLPLTHPRLLGAKLSTSQLRWKRFCIPTCYGYWCPKQLVRTAVHTIRDGVDIKVIGKIDPILQSKDALRKKYIEIFEMIEGNIRKLGNGGNGKKWSKDDAIKRLDKWLPRVISKLQDKETRWRLLGGVSGPVVVPNLWIGDELALQEFEQSFCDHIVIELSKRTSLNWIAKWLQGDYSGNTTSCKDWDSGEWLSWLRNQKHDPFIQMQSNGKNG